MVLTKKIENGIINKIAYCIYIFKQMYHLATSKVVVLDTYCITACVLSHKKDTKIIQIWHALGAIKKFGYQTLNRKSGSSEITAKIMHMHENYDYILAPSKVTSEIYKEAFNVEENNFKYIGMPRIDYILKEDKQKQQEIYDTYPELREKQNILYVPTFRKGEKVQIDELVQKIDTKKYNLIIKLHPLDLKEYQYVEKQGVIYDQKFKTYDLLKIANKVITDYSSLSIEASLLGIPIYFYLYDLEKYKQETGLNFNFDLEEIGKYKATNVDELLKNIDESYDYKVLYDFRKKYISVDTEDVTKQIVDFIVRLIRNEETKNIGNEHIKEKQNV